MQDISRRDRHPRVVFTTDRYPPRYGGAGELARGLAGQFVRFGASVTVVCTEPATRKEPIEVDPGNTEITVRRLPEAELQSRMLRKLFGSGWALRLLVPLFCSNVVRTLAPFRSYAIIRALVSTNCDLLVCTNLHGLIGYHCALASRILHCRLIIVPCIHPNKPGGVLASERRLLEWADGVAANTAFEKKVLLAMGIPEGRVAVIGPGVDESEPDHQAGLRFREAFGLGDHPVVAYVGRLNTSKGIASLISAMRAVRERDPNVHLVVAGAQGNYHPDEHPEWRRSGQPGGGRNLLLLNVPEREKDGLLNACDLLVLPSRLESFGIVVTEAWLREKPVVVADCGASREIVSDGLDGRVVPDLDPGPLADAISDVLEDPYAATEMGRQGRAKARRCYLWSVLGERFFNWAMTGTGVQ